MTAPKNLAEKHRQQAAERQARIEDLRQMVTDGISIGEAARQFGITRGGLNDWGKRHGLTAEMDALRANGDDWAAAQVAARLEDLEWMVSTGESLAGAAVRLGIDEKSLVTWGSRHRVGHLIDALQGRDGLAADVA